MSKFYYKAADSFKYITDQPNYLLIHFIIVNIIKEFIKKYDKHPVLV